MNNDINIVIKSQSQPDGGEGYSAGQAVRVTCMVKKACAQHAGRLCAA